jgi:cell division protein FtsW
MERRAAAKPKRNIGHIDYPIVLMIGLLCAFGLVMVFSASYYYAQNTASVGYDGYYYIRKQAVYLAIGFPMMLAISYFDFRKLERFKLVAVLISIALLIAVLIFGQETNGARRWIVIGGQSIQPSEIAKFGMMLYMASFASKKYKVMHSFTKGMLPMLLVIGVICGLVMLQPNMSMAVIMGLMGYALLFIGGCDGKQMFLLAIVLGALFALLAIIEPYRLARLTSFVDPWEDPLGDGYQLIQSYYALGAGGLFGVGLNNSRQKLLYMTYGESDFIFAIVAEELGLIGALLVLAAFGFIVYRGIRIALLCRDRFGSMLAGGITVVFGLQVFVNIGVCVGVLPTTGQALPFISAGGSSMMIFLAAMGVLLNIARFNSRQEIEPEKAQRRAARGIKHERVRA